MGSVIGGSKLFGGGGEEAAKASERAANIQAEYQREALEYLKEREAIPQAYREAALGQLGAEYGITLDEQGNVISGGMSPLERAQQSPLYQTLLQGGEEAALRARSATGGLRSGGAISDVADVENRALLAAYNQQLQGLGGLAGLTSYAPQIAQQTAGIGQTLAQGQVAAAQAQQAGQQQQTQTLLGLGQLALGAAAFSDIRLKDNIQYRGNRYGHNWYTWDWNEEAEKLGLNGNGEGVMAHEIYETRPDVIGEESGYITVDYRKLGIH